jgi:hypothetical protein
VGHGSKYSSALSIASPKISQHIVIINNFFIKTAAETPAALDARGL